MSNTREQFAHIIQQCRTTFLAKTSDYGTSWRVYRPISVADQIYIKARRIRNIQENAIQKIGDDIPSEFQGIINYSIIGLIQLDLTEEDPEQLDPATVANMYDDKVNLAMNLMADKNHDYGEAWRAMSEESFADLILAKILRIKQIIGNKGHTQVSEGIDANFFDILNYAVFALILREEATISNQT